MKNDFQPIYFDSHMHTPLCKHAQGHPNEYVAVGEEKGLAGVIFTCHSPMPNRFSHHVRMSPDQFDEYCELIQGAADNAPDGFEVRLGMESDFFPGMEKWLTELHQKADFHYILGSVHWHIPEYIDAFWSGDKEEFEKQYFLHLAESAESGLFDALAHPDLIKNSDPDSWDFERARPLVAEALDRIADTGVAMELNTSGLRKPYSEMNPGREMLAMMAERKIPVVVGSDSHVPERVGDQFEKALCILEEAGFDTVNVFKERKRKEIKIADVLESLRSPAATR
ncbi:MAG: histidinol-phosphatase [Verrucomicrobiales bacterium]|nr:histidinol-phosphatase [Verrucomicrobiales bacterium]